MEKLKSTKTLSNNGALADGELQTLVNEAFPQYSLVMFEMLRAHEIDKYLHFGREYIRARESLDAVIGNQQHAKQVLKYHVEAEKQGYTFKRAENNVIVAKTLEVFRGYVTAPLMADIPTADAYFAWRSVGSWSGALIMAGLTPMTKAEKRDAIRKYIIARASPELIHKSTLKKYSPELIDELQIICDDAKRSGKYPSYEVIEHLLDFPECKNSEKDANGILAKMGFPAQSKPIKPMTKVDKFHAASVWWRESKNYRNFSKRARKK